MILFVHAMLYYLTDIMVDIYVHNYVFIYYYYYQPALYL